MSLVFLQRGSNVTFVDKQLEADDMIRSEIKCFGLLSLAFCGPLQTVQAETALIDQTEMVECVMHPNYSKTSGRLPAQIAKHEYEDRYALFRDKRADFVSQYGNILVPRDVALVIKFENNDCVKNCSFEILMTRRLEYHSRIDCRITK